VSTDNVDDSKVVEDVHVPSKFTSVIDDASADSCPSIFDEVHVSFEGTSDVMNALMESSTSIAEETYVYEDDQKSQEIDIESIVATPNMSSSSKSVEFLAMLHQVNSGTSG